MDACNGGQYTPVAHPLLPYHQCAVPVSRMYVVVQTLEAIIYYAIASGGVEGTSENAQPRDK